MLQRKKLTPLLHLQYKFSASVRATSAWAKMLRTGCECLSRLFLLTTNLSEWGIDSALGLGQKNPQKNPQKKNLVDKKRVHKRLLMTNTEESYNEASTKESTKEKPS